MGRLAALVAPAMVLALAAFASPASAGADPLSDETLNNLAYPEVFSDKPMLLVNGSFAGNIDIDGDVSPVIASILDVAIVHGDMTGDGVPDAVVIVAENSGGSGFFDFAAVVANDQGTARIIASPVFADRGHILDIGIVNQQLLVDVTVPGPREPACCPTWRSSQVFEMRDGKLVLVSQQDVPPPAPPPPTVEERLEAGSWQLRSFLRGSPAVRNVTVTVTFSDHVVFGSTGCNAYGGYYTLQGATILIDAVPRTDLPCAVGTSAQEIIYLGALVMIQSFALSDDDTRLTLNIANGTVLVFDRLVTAPARP